MIRIFLKLLFFSVSLAATFPFFSYSQVSENFNDGDFSSNPAWSGDAANWEIINGALHSADSVLTNYKFYLSTPSALATDAQWEWWDSLQFNTSSANYIDVYLVSDSANLKAASFNGYFVRIGNTTDDICLYKRTGATSTKIIDGADNLLNSSNNVMRIKVTRDINNLWTLFRDSTGTGNNFFSEGTATDASFTTSSFFGLAVQQSTLSFAKRHWFDNFYAGPITGDTVAPVLLLASVISSTQLDLKFSEFVSSATAENELNYSANNGLGNPLSAIRDALDSTVVHLTFSASFGNGITNTINVNGIQDLAGNTILPANQDFTFLIVVAASYKDVVINEIFADPSPQVGLPNAEFIEIFNTSSFTFDLAGWKFSDGTSTATLGSFILLPDSFLILCPTANVTEFSSFGSAQGLSSFPSLNNTGDNLTLSDNNSMLIDAVNYSDSWYKDAIKDDGGWTLELINPGNPCSSADNWTASGNSMGGTPGIINSVFDTTPDTQAPSLSSVNIVSPSQIEIAFSEPMDSTSIAGGTYLIDNGLSVLSVSVPSGNNSVITLALSPPIDTAVVYTISAANVWDCSGNLIGGNDSLQFVIGYQPSPGDILINEIFADPSPSVGLPDAEYVELFNRSNKFIDLSSCNFSGASFPSGTAVAPGEFIILSSATNANLFSSFGNFAAMGNWSTTFLTNSGKDLLFSYGSEIIDRVFYNILWYQDNVKDDGGWSLERINPDHPCSTADNWKASADSSGGTPGKINSVYSTSPDVLPPHILSVVATTQSQLMITFSEGMDSASLVAGYTINNGISVTGTQPLGPDFSSVLLDVSPPVDSATLYTGNISYVSDCSGNSVYNQAFSFGVGVNAGLFDVLINEIYADPDGAVSSLPEVEFVELYNATSKVVNLNGCWFSDGSGFSALADAVIFPNDYLILCSSASISSFSGYGKTLGLSGFPSLNNAGDNLTLKDPSGNLIHAVDYTDDWYGDDVKKAGGWTLELIDPGNPCGSGNNWRASNDPSGGTPGKVNSVFGANPDNSPPLILSAFAIDPLSVVLYFDETMDSLSAKNASYTIDNGISVFGIIVLDKKTVQVNLSTALVTNVMYTVTASGMSDCIGNITSGTSAGFALTENGEAGDLVINEVLFNPRTGGSDFVEIYNKSGKIINLQNWSLAKINADTISSIYSVSKIPLVMFPEDYLVFTKDTSNIKTEYPSGKPENFRQMATLPSYNNDSSTVILLAGDSSVYDAFSYNEEMHFALLKEVKGVSLERIDFNRPTSDITNWHSAAEAVGWATPGYRNSQYNPSEGDGSTVSVEPEIFSPDNDGFNDVVNIHYLFDNPGFLATIVIYDAKGRLIRTLAKNELLATGGTYSWDGISDSDEKGRIGIYIIYFEAFDLSGKVLQFKKTCVLGGKLN